ncbi:MAG: hypothetical protein H6817_01775 [Phycisphaerales bacterium]|nr:hypothetical protein [Phycisphaerales bacterium]
MTRLIAETHRYRAASVVLFTVAVVLAGCAPAQFTEGVAYTAKQENVRDATASAVRGMGHLRFDTALRSNLDDALAVSDIDKAKPAAREVLNAAHNLAVHATDSELARMSPDALHKLAGEYGMELPDDLSTADLRTSLTERYDQESAAALSNDLERISSAGSTEELDGFLADIRKRIEPQAGNAGRLGRVLLTSPMYLPAAIGAELADAGATKRTTIAEFDEVQVYRPAVAETASAGRDWETASLNELARRYAPVFVQEINPSATYASSDDRIGRVVLSGAPGDYQVNIDVDDPVVYWKHTTARIHDQRFDQLVYVAWYPSRPALSSGDPQAGRIDGVVVRMTLDHHRRPAVYEFVRTCGCYHTLWVADFIERDAKTEFGGPLAGMAYAVQQKSERNRELFMPALVGDDGASPHRPAVMVNAGEHLVLTIDTSDSGHYERSAAPPQTYRLEPYDDLTHLPVGDQVASMFNGEGLVYGAARPEGWMLAPTGMLQAGRPRQLGTMKIRMDAYDYDDPRLLERNLRLPSTF